MRARPIRRGGVGMAGPAEHTQQDAVVPLLRQLSVGLGAYRLYPDEPERPAFVAAAERVAEAARRALTDGPSRKLLGG